MGNGYFAKAGNFFNNILRKAVEGLKQDNKEEKDFFTQVHKPHNIGDY